MSSWFEYSITRPFTLRHFTTTLFIAGTLWVSFVTLVSIAAVGYENVAMQMGPADFNSSSKLWYEKVFPTSQWIPSSKVCEGNTIKVRDSPSLPWARLMSSLHYNRHVYL